MFWGCISVNYRLGAIWWGVCMPGCVDEAQLLWYVCSGEGVLLPVRVLGPVSKRSFVLGVRACTHTHTHSCLGVVWVSAQGAGSRDPP